ncbi:hypothetical protein J2T08_005563 [Neorhizobium galegae]|nr:hypothetical protein [Neorhizobium galegae]
MAWKSDVYLNGEGTHLACHSHGALFDIETGECVLGPCWDKLTRVELTLPNLGRIGRRPGGWLTKGDVARLLTVRSSHRWPSTSAG